MEFVENVKPFLSRPGRDMLHLFAHAIKHPTPFVYPPETHGGGASDASKMNKQDERKQKMKNTWTRTALLTGVVGALVAVTAAVYATSEAKPEREKESCPIAAACESAKPDCDAAKAACGDAKATGACDVAKAACDKTETAGRATKAACGAKETACGTTKTACGI